jgi:hypothetical protein
VAAGPYRQLRDLEAILAAAGWRPVLSTSSHRAVAGADLAGLFGVPHGGTCQRVTITLHHPATATVLALSDHLSGWTTHPATATATRRTSPTVTTTRARETPPPHQHR